MEVPLLVDDFLRRAARLYPDKIAVVDGAERITYREFENRSRRLANALLGLGVRKGDRVAILSPNSHFLLESFYGTSQIGAVLVPLNYRLQAAELEYILGHAGAVCLLADREFTEIGDQLRPRLEGIRHWISARDEGETPAGWTDWNTLLEEAAADPPPPA